MSESQAKQEPRTPGPNAERNRKRRAARKSRLSNTNQNNNNNRTRTPKIPVGVVDARLNEYVKKFVMNDNVASPRPIPNPTAVFTLTRVVNVSVPLNDTLGCVVIAQPDIHTPYLIYNPHGVTSSTSVVLEFLNSGTILLPGQNYAIGTRDIYMMFPLVPNNPNVGFIQPVFVLKGDGVIGLLPDYRDPEALLFQEGGRPYYNFVASTGLSTISLVINVKGSTSGTPSVNMIEYDNLDLSGSQTSSPFIATAANANNYTFTLTAYVPPVGTRSITFAMDGWAKIDSVSVANGFNISNWHLDNYSTDVLSAVNPADLSTWNSVVQVTDAWSVTGLHMTVTNTTAAGFTGGRVGMSLIPASYAIPSNFHDAYSLINSRKNYKFSGNIVKGAHGMWSPRDLRESLHQTINERLYSNRIVAAVQIPASGSAAASIQVTLSLRLEMLCNSQVIPTVVPPSSSYALDTLFAAIRQQLDIAYGENPDHLERLKTIARSVANNPQVRTALSSIGKAGLTALAGLLI